MKRITITAMNRVETNILTHWETIAESWEEDDDWKDEDIHVFLSEIDLFMNQILPFTPIEGWAYWTDGIFIYTENRFHAKRLADAVSPFMEAADSFVDIDEIENDLSDAPVIYRIACH